MRAPFACGRKATVMQPTAPALLAMWPRAPEPLVLLAAAKEQLRDLRGAIEAYEELLFLEPPVPRNVEDIEGIEALRERTAEVGR